MGEIEQRPSPGSRLGAPENSGISTLEHGQKPPPTPSGKLMSIKIQMLDDTQEAFEVPVSWGRGVNSDGWAAFRTGRFLESPFSVTGGGGSWGVRSTPLPPAPALSSHPIWFSAVQYCDSRVHGLDRGLSGPIT